MICGQSFTDQRIMLDGQTFIDCAFSGCTLVFAASAPVQMDGCDMVDCLFEFAGAASLTANYVRTLATAAPNIAPGLRAALGLDT